MDHYTFLSPYWNILWLLTASCTKLVFLIMKSNAEEKALDGEIHIFFLRLD